MPRVENAGVPIYYEADGEGDAVAFVGDLGTGAWLWGWQAPAVAGRFRAVVADTRGAGRSGAPPGPYSIDDMAGDLEAVLADAGVRRATVVGAGMGGMVALRYALAYSRAERLALLGTAAAGEAFDPGPLAGAPDDLEGLLTPAFREANPEAVERIAGWRREEDAGGAPLEAQIAAVEGFDARDRLYEVTVPALVAAGEDDPVVDAGTAEALAEDLPRGEFRAFGGEHLFFVERSRPVTDALVGFLERS